MKNFKKVLALVLVVVMALGLITVSNAAFTDAESIEKTEAAEVLTAIGVIDGFPDGSFKPQDDVTRAQMAKMVAVIMNKGDEEVGETFKSACRFTDSASNWAAGFIAYCAQEGIISGKSETKFDPDGKVTGTEAAKMLLCALGYDADAEGFKGATWTAAVLSKATKAGLIGADSNLSIDYSAPMNRENAAQMMLNALKADMVDYAVSSTINVGDVTINNNSKAEPIVKASGTKYGNIVDETRYGAYYTVQLGEEMFKDLVNETYTPGATTDSFARRTNKWTFEGTTASETALTPDLVLKDKLTGGEFYTQIGKLNLYETKTVKVAGVDTEVNVWTTHYYVDGVQQTFPTNIKSGNYDDIGRVGDVIEIYRDNANKVFEIVQINYYAAKIAQVYAAKMDANGDEETSAFVTLKAIDGFTMPTYSPAELTNGSTTLNNSVETNAFTAADKDAIVVYTKSDKTGVNAIKSVVKAEEVTALYSSYVANESVTIGGTKYNTSAAIPAATITALALNENATAYLDPNGNAIWVEGVESNDYAYLMKKAVVGGVSTSTEALLVFADGTSKTVTLETSSASKDEGKAYAYTVNANGTYKLIDVAAPYQAETATATTYTTNQVNVFDSVKANSNTLFVVETYDSAAKAATYTTYTGIANVPEITAMLGYDSWRDFAGNRADDTMVALTKPGENFASIVFVFGATTKSASKDVTALYLTGNETVGDDGNGKYYTVKAIVNGAETTVKVAEGATGITLPAAGNALVVTDELSVDTNGYVTGIGALDGNKLEVYNDFAYTLDGTNKIYSDIYTAGILALDTAEKSVPETTPVYAYNASSRTFQITTIGAYAAAKDVKTIALKYDTSVTPKTLTAIYLIETN